MQSRWLREPKNGRAIAFVHGLTQTPATAWRSESAYWPDLVKSEGALSEYGIYLFHYNAALGAGNYSVPNAADALFEYFQLDKLSQLNQLVFIAYSLGGLVTRQFILAREKELVMLGIDFGLFLVASPSLGSDYANIATILPHISSVQVKDLRFAQDNTWLNDLDKRFSALRDSGRFPIFGRELIEADPLKIPKLFSKSAQIVTAVSGARYFKDPLVIPGCDHLSIGAPKNGMALQHRTLVQFVLDHAARQSPTPAGVTPEAPSSQAPSNSLGKTADAGIGDTANSSRATDGAFSPLVVAATDASTYGVLALPPPDASDEEVYRAASRLLAGRRYARALAAQIARQHGDIFALLRAGAALPRENRMQLSDAAAWLRFANEHQRNSETSGLAADLVAKLSLDEPEKSRLTMHMLGCAGRALVFPAPDWTYRWNVEKLSIDFFRANIVSALVCDHEDDIRFCIRRSIEVARVRGPDDSSLQPIHFFEYLSALRGISVRHGPIILSELARPDYNAPAEFLEACLYHVSVAVNERSLEVIKRLLHHENQSVRQTAMVALAYLPKDEGAVSNAKSAVLTAPDEAWAAAAGVDRKTEAAADLDAVLSAGANEGLLYTAAWALGKLSQVSDAAFGFALNHAKHNADPIARALLLAGLASGDYARVSSIIQSQIPKTFGLERFLMEVAGSYSGNAKPMFKFLAATSEANLFIPFLRTPLRRTFIDAANAAASGDLLMQELLDMADLA